MKNTFASAALPTKVAILIARWCGIWGLLVLCLYVGKGPAAALAKLDEFAFASIVACVVWPALLAAYWVEPKVKRRFPLGASFIVITCALVPSAALGIWVAIAVMRQFH
ncbi:MAG TPA: hypothetical protein VEQ09_02865 [Aquabacterium sp.]|nr:hypothetical protein [Aquabacterium sp.]